MLNVDITGAGAGAGLEYRDPLAVSGVVDLGPGEDCLFCCKNEDESRRVANGDPSVGLFSTTFASLPLRLLVGDAAPSRSLSTNAFRLIVGLGVLLPMCTGGGGASSRADGAVKLWFSLLGEVCPGVKETRLGDEVVGDDGRKLLVLCDGEFGVVGRRKGETRWEGELNDLNGEDCEVMISANVLTTGG